MAASSFSKHEWETVYIGFGGNLGEPERNYEQVIALLSQEESVRVLRFSSLRRYPPLGPPQPDYLNGVIEISTLLLPEALLDLLHGIEDALGRTRGIRWGPRTVDLDILLWGAREIETPRLKVPHPGLCQRRFVLEPLAELSPETVEPRSGKTIIELLNGL